MLTTKQNYRDKSEESKTDKPDVKDDNNDAKKKIGRRSSRFTPEHGYSSEKVYPISESSLRLLKSNARVASLLLSSSSAFLGVSFSTFVNIFTTEHGKKTIELIFIILIILSIFLFILYLIEKKPVNDEWSRIEHTTNFNDEENK
jgi:hypothetical protein